MGSIAERNREKVKIVLAEGSTLVRHGLRNALVSEGYRDVQVVTQLAVVQTVLSGGSPDLLIIDGHMPDGDTISLVRDIRNGAIGRNPFLPIILMTWESDRGRVGRAVNSGVDLILVKPVAPADLLARIDGVAFDRKPFLARGSYIGPDRRAQADDDGPERFHVPNTLRDRLEGRKVDPAALSKQVDLAMQEISSARIENAVFKLADVVDDICEDYANDSLTGSLEDALHRIKRTVEQVQAHGTAEIQRMCGLLMKAVSRMSEKPEEVDCKQMELLRPLSQSILLAVRPDADVDGALEEISSEISGHGADQLPVAGREKEPCAA